MSIVIIQRGNNERIQLWKFSKVDILIGLDMKMLNTIIYLNITRLSDYWRDLYTPDHFDDLLIHYKHIDFKTLAKEFIINIKIRLWDSQSNSVNNHNCNYQMLNIYGSSGKMSIIVTIARIYNNQIILTYEYIEKKEFKRCLQINTSNQIKKKNHYPLES